MSARALVLLSSATVLGMAPWFATTVVAGAMTAELSLSPAAASWLTLGVQLGFVLGSVVSALFLLSDRFSAKRLAALCAGLAAVATAALTTPGVGPWRALLLRVVTGAALAGVYPPGIKIAAGWTRDRRGTAIGLLVGAVTLGSASPHLLRAIGPGAEWRRLLLAAATSAALGALLFAFAVREGPYQSKSAPFEPRAVLAVIRDRGVMLATGGYLGHMWELYAMWSSIGLFLADVVRRQSAAPWLAPILAFVSISAGGVGSVVAGMAADRVGRSVVTIWAMAISGLCALSIGAVSREWFVPTIALSLIWGIAIVADSAQFSACVAELSPTEYVGTAVTLQTAVGFLLTLLTIRLVPAWAARWGWEWAYVPLAIGPALGILSMQRLRTRYRV